MNLNDPDDRALKRAGRAVAARRMELGASQASLAKAAGVDAKTLRSLERGERWPQDANRAKIATALQWRHGALDDLLVGSAPEALIVESCDTMEGFKRWQHWQNEVHAAVHGEDGVDLSGLSIDAKMELLGQILTGGNVRLDLMTAVEGQIIIRELAATFARRVDASRRAHPNYYKPGGGLGLSPAQMDDATARGIPFEDYADDHGLTSLIPDESQLGQWAEDEEFATRGDFTRAAMAGTSELEQDDAAAARRGEESQDHDGEDPA